LWGGKGGLGPKITPILMDTEVLRASSVSINDTFCLLETDCDYYLNNLFCNYRSKLKLADTELI
jgi:hypothetical protein